MEDADATEDIYPLGSDPIALEESRPKSSEPRPSAACPVCDDLQYKVAPADVRKWSSLLPGKKFEAFFGVDTSRPEAAARMAIHPESGRPETYFAGDWVPPGYRPAWNWAQSSSVGCVTCGIVAAAVSRAFPDFWADAGPQAYHKRIWAQAVPGVCVMVTMTDTRQRFLRRRHQAFEISSVSCE